MSRRTDRIAEQVRSEVARILREEVTDPRIGLVSLTRVDVAPDLGNARVFWSSLGDAASREQTARGLDSAAAFVRRCLARVLTVKRVPEIRFLYDPSLENGDRVLATLREVAPDDEDSPDGPA